MFRNYGLALLIAICVFAAGCAAGAESERDDAPADPISAICNDWELLSAGERTPDARERFALKIRMVPDAERILKERIEAPEAQTVIGDAAIWAYAQIKGPAAAPLLAHIIFKGKWSDATAAASALGAVGDESAIPLLLPGLVADSQSTILASTSALMYLSQNEKIAPKFIEQCTQSFRDSSVKMKVNLLAALSKVTTHAAEAVVEYGLADESAEVQAAALSLLTVSQIRRKEISLRALCHQSRDQDVLKRVANALGRAKCTDSIPDLISLLKNRDAAVKSAAHWALENITSQQFADNSEAWQTWYAQQTKVAAQLQTSILKQIASGPADTKPLVIEDAIQIVPLRPKLVPLLLDCRHDPDFCVRAAAYHALGESGGLTSPSALLEGLSDARPEVAYTAWRALQELTGQRFPMKYLQWQEWCSEQR